MKKIGIRLAVTAAALLMSIGVQAAALRTTVTFDPVNGDDLTFAPLLLDGDEFYQQAFGNRTAWFAPFSNSDFAQPGDLVGFISEGGGCDFAALSCPTNNDTNFVGLLNDAAMVFGMTDGFRFSVKSLSASFLGNGLDPLPTGQSAFLALQGIRGGAAITSYFALPGAVDGELGFTTVNTGAFGSFEFDYVYAFAYVCGSGGDCNAFSTNRAQFALDDIVMEHVPEPASLALVGVAGLALLGARRRRNA